MDFFYQFLPRLIWLTFLEHQWVLCLYSALSQESNYSMQMWHLSQHFLQSDELSNLGTKSALSYFCIFFSPFCWPSWIGLIIIINNNNKLYSGALDYDIARELLIFNGMESLGSLLLLLMSSVAANSQSHWENHPTWRPVLHILPCHVTDCVYVVFLLRPSDLGNEMKTL